jgi:hypothetical protein
MQNKSGWERMMREVKGGGIENLCKDDKTAIREENESDKRK